MSRVTSMRHLELAPKNAPKLRAPIDFVAGVYGSRKKKGHSEEWPKSGRNRGKETSTRDVEKSGRSLFDRRERQAKAVGNGLIGQPAAVDIETGAQMRIFHHGRKSILRQGQTERQRGIVQRLA